MFHFWLRPKYFCAVAAREAPPVRCWYCVLNALLQDCAKSVLNGVPGGSDSCWSLW